MRPERVVVEGFGTFRDRTEVDFTGVDLFALTGPTGAGKSTVIDAMVFALYGSIPRLDDRRAVAPVISSDRVEARVQLDFSVGGEEYTVVRVVRETATKAKAASANRTATTKEARLERRADGEVLAGSADEVTPAVERLLGLSFEHFTTCVVLPQGEFARFLHAKPRERQDLLVELLDLGVYGRMAGLARERSRVADQQVAFLAQERSTLDWATDDESARLAARVAELDAVVATLDELAPALDEAARRADERRAQAADAADCVQRLGAVVVPSGVDDLAAAAAAARDALDGARADEEATAARLAEAEDARAAAGDATALELVRQRHADREAVQARVAKGESVVADADENLQAATDEAKRCRAAHEAATAALDAARVADRAAELATHLHVGDDCPVCGQQVHELPTARAPELEAAEAAERAAAGERDRADSALAAATNDHSKAVTLLASLRQQIDEFAAALEGQPSAAETEAALAAIAAADDRVRSARDAASAATTARRRAEQAVADADRRAESAWAAFDEARDRVAVLEPPPVDRSDLRAAWEPLVAWAAAETERYRREEASLVAEATEAEAARRSVVERMAAACEAAGLHPEAGRPARDAVVTALADARADVASIDQARRRADELATQIAALEADRDVARALASHLDARHFEKWVLDEALARLVAAATVILFELSGRTYSLLLDSRTNAFYVRDHLNADALRSARTLSGGETFLASLALALALADQVAELAAGGAVRLESIFLDEGFGTLDPDTLDIVATAIEELGAQGRLVGLVSHVPALAERMPVRFVVTKQPGGSTVERVDS